jgi:hypothetical protein
VLSLLTTEGSKLAHSEEGWGGWVEHLAATVVMLIQVEREGGFDTFSRLWWRRE